MTELTFIVLLFVGAIMPGASARAEEQFQKLNEAQILAKFAGMELTDEVHWDDLISKAACS